MSAHVPFPSDDSIAVVGAACRLPGGIHSLDDLWAVLVTERDMVGEVPADRFPAGDFVDRIRRRPGQSYTAAGGFLQDIYGFDASYFIGISPREASRMDPQQRLLLEMAVEALDDAGIDSTALEGTDTSVFIGCSSRDYGELQAYSPESGNAYTVTGMAGAIVANRLSHFFDWRGQSVMVDTACSSALTAVHQACEHLKSGHSRVAVAGGVNVLINPQGFGGFSAASMLSPTGRCRAFSAQADGFVRAEGGGLVLLKRLCDARADGDRIHGVILGSGTNNDGRTPGLALPSASAQQALLREVYDRARVLPDDLAYLEAHGTGTPVGDPLECEAVGRVLGQGRSTGVLPIGSVKANIGHLEAASGIAGLLKALLVLKHRQIPASLHCEEPNPSIDFTGLNVRPVTRPQPLTHDGLPLAGVNSFGFGGANAHVILAAPAPNTPDTDKRAWQDSASHRTLPVVVSARTDEALRVACQEMAQHLQFTTDPFYDVAYTATVRRHHYERRAAVLATSAAEAADALLSMAVAGDGEPSWVTGRPGKVAFVFSGNGSQWPGMGTDLLRTEPAFLAAVETVDAELQPRLGWSVLSELTAESPRLDRTDVAQPLLFALQVGLLRLLASYGIEPDAVAGHSVGEIAAAYASGCLDLRQACQVVVARSTAQAATAGTGRMAACGLGPKEAEKELAAYDGRIELAGINTDQDVTLAGPAEALAELGRQLSTREVFFRQLDLDYAFHSRAMDPIRHDVTDSLLLLRPGRHQRTFISTVTGDRLDGSRLDADYWWRNVREPVRFAEAVRALADSGCTQFVEIGPHAVLAGYLRRLVGAEATVALCRRDQEAPASVRRGAAHVIAAGARVRHCFSRPGAVVTLPSYPFQREECRNGQPEWWVTVPQDKTLTHPVLGRRAAVAEPTWHQLLSTSRLGWLTDHRVDGSVVMPGTCYVEAFLAAGRAALNAACEVTGLDIVRPLTLPGGDDPTSVTVQTSLSVETGLVCFASRTTLTSDWTLHARGRVRRLLGPVPPAIDPATLRSRLSGPLIEATTHYERAGRAGLAYGAAFQVLTGLQAGAGDVVATYRLPTDDQHVLEAHPVILDGALQAAGPLLVSSGDGRMFLPTAVEAIRVWHHLPAQGLVHARLRDRAGSDALVDITVGAEDGTVCAELTGCRLRGVQAAKAKAVHLQELTHTLRASGRATGRGGAACPWPNPEATVATTARQRLQVDTEHRDGYAEFAPQVKTAVGHWAAAAMAELLPQATAFGTDDLLAARVRPHHLPYLRLLIHLAEQAGLIRTVASEGEARWRMTGVAQPHEHTQQLVDRFPEWITAIAVYVRCGSRLTDILTGRVDPRELLFTEADRHLVEGFYSDTPQTRLHARTASILLARMLRDWPEDRPLRVLEVGAGTGALSAYLLPLLPAPLTTYVYSDVSAAFFPRAQTRFTKFDFLTYRTLDLNTDPAEQDFTPESFDLVIASNVLHATRDLKATCERIAGLLAPGGQLLAIESHDTEIVGPCFGLLEEFWAFTDTEVRSSPLLNRDSWPTILRAAGFDTAAQTSSVQREADEDYSVLLARRTESSTVAQPPVPARATGSWLVVTPHPAGPVAQHLAHALTAAGATSVGITDSGTYQPPAPMTHPVKVVALLDHGSAGPDAAEAVTETTELIRTAAGLCAAAEEGTSSLWVVTGPTGLFPAPERNDEASPVHAAAWGVGRVLGNERPLLKVRRISLHSCGDVVEDAERVTHELLHADDEDEVVLVGSGRFTPRVTTLPSATRPAAAHDHYALRLERPGRDPVVAWTAVDPPAPAPGEVVVQVRAAALNYRDVMLAQGLLPPGAEPSTGTAPQLGIECAGDVVAVGPEVTSLDIGDRVYAFAHGALASHASVRAEQTGRIPDNTTYAEAATLPAVYLTVQHSLERCARLRAGETVLVHGGAGGIGLAALRHARNIGARAIATAGSPAKRDLLHALGVEHVLNSRDLRFAQDVQELTGGGVDVVLNSLAGEAIGRGLECLRPGGRFVELGKRDIYANSPVLLGPFRNNLSYHAVDITRLIADTPAEAAAAFRTVTDRITDGTYRPLPHRAYSADRVAEALGSLRHSRHLGKVVITFSGTEPVDVHEPVTSAPLDPSATYLISGGLSGLGAATARHLVDRGARHLALIGRRGARSPEASALLEDLHRKGAQATASAADITDRQAITRIVRETAEQGRPVRGIVHAAMQLDDAPLDELTPDRIRRVLAAKVLGAQVLDETSRNCELDFFVTYSSVAALVGNLHQAPYAAANLYLESLMRRRRTEGRPGLALAWGGISDTGYVARTLMADTIARSGIGLISPRTALDALDRHRALANEPTVAVGAMDWERLSQILPALTGPRFSAQLRNAAGASTPQAADGLGQRLKEATSAAQRITLITDALTALAASILQTSPDRVNPTANLADLGLDSLMGAELKVQLHRAFGCELPLMELMGAATLVGVAQRLDVLVQRHQQETTG
ncbi:SDR family NAD(P)-dependent oxidoreductase [Streptomyces sp. HNM0663]|uniref:SDR family NAD(P)-dependent oxidoreductase n=1 Tax=Streptomyces chengmaiensis TaxID=3040919 RepID=A0ABT6HII7_9ACTN|nr:type I polyketide synthase [Streptomyces chengmaiensis]MDH2388508.1 SDR family NAD(P)-dependent oxidoreductase [Streptomyces chengmaiensis]